MNVYAQTRMPAGKGKMNVSHTTSTMSSTLIPICKSTEFLCKRHVFACLKYTEDLNTKVPDLNALVSRISFFSISKW